MFSFLRGVSSLPADSVIVVPLQVRHDLVESVYLLPLAAGHKSSVLKRKTIFKCHKIN